jgi:hypothetical protein
MNIAKQTLKLIKELKKTYSFNGVDIEYIRPEGCWHREYSVFILTFDTYDLDLVEYFDHYRFAEDWKNYIKSWFPDCKINYYDSCGEIEIIGPNNEKFYNKNVDEIEEYMEKHKTKKLVIFRRK